MNILRARRRATRACAIAAAVLWALGASTGAGAAACAGADSCPYSQVSVIGQRAEGVLRFPEAIAVGPRGDVYVGDQFSFVVQKFTPTGRFETEWGGEGQGTGQFGGIGGLAVDAAGDVYVVDSAHSRIEKFDPNGAFITQWGSGGGSVGQFRFGAGGATTGQPAGGSVAVAGNSVYVADTENNRIQRFALDGSGASAFGSYGSSPGNLNHPKGVAATASAVYVADDDNHRVQQFDLTGHYVASAGSGAPGTGAGQFNFPYDVAVDPAGNVYVADNINARVVKLSSSLGYISSYGSFGTGPGQLEYPRALATDSAGNVYVTDTANNRIQVFTPAGTLLRSWGINGRGPGQFIAPRGVSADATGAPVVADSIDNRLEHFAPNGAFLGAISSYGSALGRMSDPLGVAFGGPRGSYYVADAGNNRIDVIDSFSLGASAFGTTSPGALQGPSGVSVSAGGDVYAADTQNDRVVHYGASGSFAGVLGSGHSGDGDGDMSAPESVAVAPSGNVYVADTQNNRVEEFAPSGQFVGKWGSRGRSIGHFNDPTGIAVDRSGNVYVTDRANSRIDVFDGQGHRLGEWGARGSDPGEFVNPDGIGIDCAGNVLVSDTDNNRVESFRLNQPPPSTCKPALVAPSKAGPPRISVSLLRRVGTLRYRSVALRVSCTQACRITISARVSAGRGRRARRVVPTRYTRALPARRTVRLGLHLSRPSIAALKAALGKGRGLTAVVSLRAVGAGNQAATLTRLFHLRR